jgi:hypothetical protein
VQRESSCDSWNLDACCPLMRRRTVPAQVVAAQVTTQ